MAATTTPPAGAATPPSLTRFVLRHKYESLAVLALVLAFVALMALAFVGRGSWSVTDASSCSTWSSANGRQQTAYARRYLTEHGALPNGSTSPARVVAAVNNGCLGAFAYDVADQTNVIQAIKGQY